MQNYANNENYEYVFTDSTLTQIHIIIYNIYYYCVRNKFITHGIYTSYIQSYTRGYGLENFRNDSMITISIYYYTNTESNVLLYFRYRKRNVFQKKCI